jgi:hypothetical protein
MSYLKYIVVTVGGQPTEILFHPVISHKAMFNALVNKKITPAEGLVSAGQVSIIGQNNFAVSAYGESTMLHMSSHIVDAELIRYDLDSLT